MAIYNKFKSKRSTVYDDIVNLIKTNGWTDVASRPATEYNVFYSAGSSGTKELYFQMVPFTTGVAYAPQINVTYTAIQINLRGTYIPGASGVAGTFERSSTYAVSILRSSAPLEQPISIWYDITPDHISIITEEENSNNRNGSWFYVGLPSRSLIDETSKSGLILAASNNNWAVNQVQANYTPVNGAPINTNVYVPGMPTSRTLKNKLIISEIAYGETTTGIRGVIDDFYYLPDKTLLEGDTITLADGRVFRFMSAPTNAYYYSGGQYPASGSSLPNPYFAFRIV